ncbi:MAG: thioredoxin domain-containing protein [Dysgonamonadaceae bacterium]
MVGKYEPNVKALITFLKLLNIKVNNSTVANELQSHPDFPSILSISDSLTKWNIPNGVGKVDIANINQLPIPFIAYTKYDVETLCIVNKISATYVHYYLPETGKFITDDRANFLKKWTGIYLIAEKTNISGEKEYQKIKRNFWIKQIIPFILLSLLLFFQLRTLVSHFPFSTGVLDNWGILVQWSILLFGATVSCLLLWHEVDSANPILHKFCTGLPKGNCDAVLNSKQSVVFNWLSWSEAGFFYFAGGLLALSFVSPLSDVVAIVSFMNILALPYTVFSIYYQARIVKQWCMLCLLVQALLILGATNAVLEGYTIPFFQISPISYVLTFVYYLVPVFSWYTLKPYLFHLQEARNIKREYLRSKFNTDVFETLLKKQKKLVTRVEDIGIDLGNPYATVQLVKVCNPYCEPCSRAHPKIEQLLKELPNLKVKIIFTTPNNPTHYAFKATTHLLAATLQKDNDEERKNVLDSWYMAEIKDYLAFSQKYPIHTSLKSYTGEIEKMFKWCKENGIIATPTFFINGYKLPDTYNIEDLSYFLKE